MPTQGPPTSRALAVPSHSDAARGVRNFRPMVTYRRASAQDWPRIARLIEACALPREGAREHLQNFIVAVRGREVVACAGAEVYGDAALLRSLAVAEASRGRGIGAALVDRMRRALGERGVKHVALLTTTAESFFARHGFAPVARAFVPQALHASEEFKGACPAGAVAMLAVL